MAKGVLILPSQWEVIKELPDNERLQILDAICDYGLCGNEPMLSGSLKMVFTLIRPQIDSSSKRYQAAVNNGKKGGRPSNNQNTNQSKNQNTNQDKNQNTNQDKNQSKNQDYNYNYDSDYNLDYRGANAQSLFRKDDTNGRTEKRTPTNADLFPGACNI